MDFQRRALGLEMVMKTDPWDRKTGFCCATCAYCAPKDDTLGRCRRHAPMMTGYPVIYLELDWCGDHKIGSNPSKEEQKLAVVPPTLHPEKYESSFTLTTADSVIRGEGRLVDVVKRDVANLVETVQPREKRGMWVKGLKRLNCVECNRRVYFDPNNIPAGSVYCRICNEKRPKPEPVPEPTPEPEVRQKRQPECVGSPEGRHEFVRFDPSRKWLLRCNHCLSIRNIQDVGKKEERE